MSLNLGQYGHLMGGHDRLNLTDLLIEQATKEQLAECS
jgi:hypothetical protein